MIKVFILEDTWTRMVLFNEVLIGVQVSAAVSVDVAKERYVKDAPYDLVLLDHDLADEHYIDQWQHKGTGTEFAEWLAETQEPTPTIIHSYNAAGAQRMLTALRLSGWLVQVQPFGMDLLNGLKKWVEERRAELDKPADDVVIS